MVSGQKSWISNGGVADTCVVFATVEPGSGHRGVTAFVLESGDEGFDWGPPMRKMGQRAIVNAELLLDDVRVPADRRLGEEGDGFRGLMLAPWEGLPVDGGHLGAFAVVPRRVE